MSDAKTNVILLAGGEKGPLYEPTGYIEKALLPIHGRAMLSRVIECFEACDRVDQIVVVGSRNLEELEAVQRIRKRVLEGTTLVQNLLHAVGYVKHRLYHSASDHPGYIISFCDAVFLTPEIVRDTLAAIEACDGEIVLHYVPRTAFEAAGLPTQRTWIPLGGHELTGSTIYYVKKFGKVIKALPTLHELRKHRKDPARLMEIIGCKGDSLEEIALAMSDRLGLQVRILLSPHPGLGMDVDKPADLELANQLLSPF